MDILICPSCGIILRGKSKFCTGCGVTVSKFSPTTLPVIAHTAAPLSVTVDPDPLVLERAMNRLQYASVLKVRADSPLIRRGENGVNGDGNGSSEAHADNGNGNGHGNGHSDPNAAASYGIYVSGAGVQSPAPSSSPQPADAGAATASRLQSVLGNAAAQAMQPGSSAPAGLVSYDQPQEAASAYSAQETVAAAVVSAPTIEAPAAPAAAETPMVPPAVETAIVPAAVEAPIVPAAVETPAVAVSVAPAVAAQPVQSEPPEMEMVRQRLSGGMAVFTQESGAVEPPQAMQQPASGMQYSSSGMQPAAATQTMAAGGMAMPSAPAPAIMAPPGALAAADFFSQKPPGFGQRRPPESVAEAAPPARSWAPPPASPIEVVASEPEQLSLSEPAVEQGFDMSEQLVSGSMPQQEEAAAAEAQPEAGSTKAPAVEAPAAPPATPPATPAPAHTTGSTVIPPPAAFDFFAATASGAAFRAPAPAAPQAEEEEPEEQQSVRRAEPPAAQADPDFDEDFADMPSVVANAIRAAAASHTGLSPVKIEVTEAPPPETAAQHDKDEENETQRGDRATRPRRQTRANTRLGSTTRRREEDSDESPRSKRESNDKGLKAARARAEKAADDEKNGDPKIKIGSFSMPRKMAITVALLIVVIGVPALMLICGAIGTIFSSVASGGGGSSAGLNGEWQFGILDTKGHTSPCVVIMNQHGTQIDGNGMEAGLRFKIGGTYNPPKVMFTKYWVDNTGNPIKDAKPITFAGAVDWVNPQPGRGQMPYYAHMSGIWQLQRRVGFGWRGTIRTFSSRWEAGLVKPGIDNRTDPTMPIQLANGPMGGLIDLLGIPHQGDSPAKWAQFFMRVAGILLLIGLGLVFASVKMFGPNGMLNIWAKKKYIPSQFQSQHMKMVREFGKPPRPGGLPLGRRVEWNMFSFWQPRDLSVPPEVRQQNPHMLVLGAGSKGKSRLLASMIAHDIQANDRAIVVVDSDGGLIDLMMSWIASHERGREFARRLVVIDPTHSTETLAYNPLEYPDDGDLQNAASAVVFGFKAIYAEPPGAQSQWNQQTADILRNSAVLLMANGKTLVDLPVLLSENDFRDVLLEKVERQKNEKAEYTALVEAWSRYKRMARTDQWINWIEPILNRVNPMLGDPRIRPILTKPKGDLNLKEIISEGKILFVKVPQGQLDQNANLLGSLLVTGLKQAALSLSLKGSSRKVPCSLYLDEFDNFIEKETFDTITSETKKFQIGFIGASKTLQGLPEDYRNQIIINVGTMACFALAKKDGDLLGPQMFRVDGRKVKHQTLQNIFNKVNTAPQFELISDEEKLNIDRVVGQEERTFFCYRVGTVAGVFHMRSPDFKDIPDKDINWTLIDQIYARSVSHD